MKAYVLMFDGDIRDNPPIAGNSVDDCLDQMVGFYGYGTISDQDVEEGWIEYVTPDPEDDKIEVWEIDSEAKTAKVVWGFWGWHWSVRDGLEQGKLPNCDKSLYEMADG